jgi:hypothetical protein
VTRPSASKGFRLPGPRLDEAASFDTVAAETKLVEGIRVRVATPAALYQLKKGTVRPLDRQDAEALRRRFKLEEE